MLKAHDRIRLVKTHRLAVMLFLSTVAIVMPINAASVTYEPDTPRLKASQLLPKKILKGTNHTVQEQVVNRGFMNHYRITSPFGELSAKSDIMVPVRVHEIAAIAELRKLSKTKVFAESVGSAVAKSAGTIGKAIDDPQGTVAGISAGVGRLFKRTARRTQDAYEKAKEVAEEEKEKQNKKQSGQVTEHSDTSDKVVEQGKKLGRRYLGVNSAFRKLAMDLKVDPYTTNVVLRDDLDSMAKVAAAGSFGTRLAMPSLPAALDHLAGVSNLVWTMNPLDLQLRNEESLRKMGVDDASIERFYENPHHTPTTQTFIVNAMARLAGVKGRPVLLRYASAVESPQEAEFTTRLVELMAQYHEVRGPIRQIVATERIPFAVASNGKGLVAGPVDYLSWTRTAADAVRDLTKAMKKHSAAAREVWVAGRVSERARKELGAMGWAVFDRAFTRLKR